MTVMARLAQVVLRHPRKIIAVWAILAWAGAYGGVQLTERLQNGGFSVSGSQSAQAVTLGQQRFSDKSQAQAYVSVVSQAAVPLATLLHDVGRLEPAILHVRGVVSMGTAEVSKNRRAVLVPLQLRGDLGQAQSYIPALEKAIERVKFAGTRAELVGQVPVDDRYIADAKKSLVKAAGFSLPITTIILFVAFLSLAAAGLPMIQAFGCLGVSLGALFLLTYALQLNIFVEDMVLVLGLGLSIDFSLFMVTRVRECLWRGGSVAEAITETLATTGRAVVVSGLTVAVSLAGLLAAGLGFLSSLAAGAIAATIVAVLAAVTLTPAMLVVLGDRVDHLPIRVAMVRARSGALWRAVALFAVRRRVAIVVVTVPVLVALALPVWGLHVKFRTFSILPGNDPVRRATTQVEHAFGPGFGAPVVVLAKASREQIETTVERQPGVAQIGIAKEGTQGWQRLPVVLKASPDTNAAEHIVQTLRAGLPRALGPSAIVGGPTAEAFDLAERINARTPRVALTILILEILVLTAVFRAPVVAVKAALSTILSVAATLGILALLFGGKNNLAYFVPLMLIATVFGLSTDYEVFLLSRVREYYAEGLSNAESIRTAVVKSARAITLAGVTMSVVFLAMASSPLTPFRQLGVGVGLAVLLDVTVVRGLLVPATMALLGDLNWWRPKLTLFRRRAIKVTAP